MSIGSDSTTFLLLAASTLGLVLYQAQRVREKKAPCRPLTKNEPSSVTPTVHARPKVTVYFASQTGTAETYARQLERDAAEHGLAVEVVDLQNVQLDDLIQRAQAATTPIVILTSTYGEGEAPDSATHFYGALRDLVGDDEEKKDDGDDQCLAGLCYGVFGLGNSQYEHFNAVAKFFDGALEQLGGNRIIDLGLGDDDVDLEGDFEAWKDNLLWPMLKKRCLSDTSSSAVASCSPELAFAVKYVEAKTASAAGSVAGDWAQECEVKVVRKLTKGARSTVHVELSIAGTDIVYHTADTLAVYPVNRQHQVETVAASLGFELAQTFELRSKQKGREVPFHCAMSIRECLARYCDLTGSPCRADLKRWASYASDPDEREALLHLASKDGKADYQESVVDSYVGISELLQRFPSISISWEHFVNLCPRLQPRLYSISSSPVAHPDAIHLTVAVDQATRADGSVFEGVCSNYLANCIAGDKVQVQVRHSTFRLPQDGSRPIVMIGPGTGIAPMRALLQERAHQRQQAIEAGSTVLYFGCRKAEEDYLYAEELDDYRRAGDLDELHLALSRQQTQKVYVQDLLRENAAATWHMIHDQGAYVYVCGAVRMGRDVNATLYGILQAQGNLSADAAEAYMATLAKRGRLVQELWA